MSESTLTAFAGQHALQPLPFDARSLSGLSERLIKWDAVNQRLELARAIHRTLAN